MLSRDVLIENDHVMEIRLHVVSDNVELIEVSWVTWHNDFMDLEEVLMSTQASENAKLSHGSVCKGSMLKDALDLLDSNNIVSVLFLESFDYN